MQRYDVAVLNARECAPEILEVEFERPVGYEFAAGQVFRLTLQTAEGEQTKTFSHASAPQEATLVMATRLSGSAFKLALSELKPGAMVRIQGPGGRLALPEGAMSPVFLTGGVGITPVRSILRAAARAGSAFEDALVIFANRLETCRPYVDDLVELAGIGVRTVEVIEQPTERWTGETGYITAELVRRQLDSVAARPFVVTGPPPMVEAMQLVLDELAVEPGLRLVERFSAAG